MMHMVGFWLELLCTSPLLLARLVLMLLANALWRAKVAITARLTAEQPTGASEYHR